MSAEALVEVEHVGHVAPEHYVHHLESLPVLAAAAAAAAAVAVDTRVKVDQLAGEVVTGRVGIHEAEVHADDLAGRPAVLVDERGGRRVDRLPRVVDVATTRELLAEQPVLPAQRLAGRRRGLPRGTRRGYLLVDAPFGHRSATRLD